MLWVDRLISTYICDTSFVTGLLNNNNQAQGVTYQIKDWDP